MGFNPFKKAKKFVKAIKSTVDTFTGKAAKDARKDAQRAADNAAAADNKAKTDAVAGENAVRIADRQRRRLGVLGLGGEAGALGTPAEKASGRGASSVLGSAGAPLSYSAPAATSPAASMLGQAAAALTGKAKKPAATTSFRRNV